MDHVKIIMTQTTYSEEETRTKLNENNGDYLQVLKEFMNKGVQSEIEQSTKPYHQAKLGMIRDSLDKACRDHRNKTS